MKWMSVKEGYPPAHSMCFVLNEKGWMGPSCMVVARYYAKEKCFVLHDPNGRQYLPLEVTHWLMVPEFETDGIFRKKPNLTPPDMKKEKE